MMFWRCSLCWDRSSILACQQLVFHSWRTWSTCCLYPAGIQLFPCKTHKCASSSTWGDLNKTKTRTLYCCRTWLIRVWNWWKVKLVCGHINKSSSRGFKIIPLELWYFWETKIWNHNHKNNSKNKSASRHQFINVLSSSEYVGFIWSILKFYYVDVDTSTLTTRSHLCNKIVT